MNERARKIKLRRVWINIRLRGGCPDPATISAWQPEGCECFAVHRDHTGRFRITHIPTGYCVPHAGFSWETKEEAGAHALCLETMAPGFRGVTVDKRGRIVNPSAMARDLLPIVQDWRDAMAAERSGVRQ